MRWRGWCAGLALCLCGCAPIVRYTDELVSARAGRSVFTRMPATFGAVVGFVAGVPIDIAALPASYVIYSAQDEAARDPLSIFLFPSVVLWRVGALIGAPIDVLEWLVFRQWQQEDALTPEAREERERELDADGWPNYPVEVLYPAAERR